MNRIFKNGEIDFPGNGQNDTGLEVSPTLNNNRPIVYVQANFEDAENEFEQEVDLVYTVEYVNEVMERIKNWEMKRKPFNKGKIYSNIRFHLVYQHLDCRELGSAILYYICCSPEMKRAQKKYPLGGFKVVLNFDMQYEESIEIEIVEPELLEEADIQNMRKTEILDDCFNLTLESKLKFLSDYHIEVLKKLISLEISSKGITLYPTIFLDELSIPVEEGERFMEAFSRIKDCELIKLSRMPMGEIVVKYELVDKGLVEYFFSGREKVTTEIVQSNEIQN